METHDRYMQLRQAGKRIASTRMDASTPRPHKGTKAIQTNKLDSYTQPTGGPPVTKDRSGTQDSPATDSSDPTLKDVMKTLTAIQASLEQKMDTISIEVNLIRADLSKNNEKVCQLEVNTASLQDDVATLQKEVHDLKQNQATQERKLDEYEGRMRRKNIRLLGVPEKSEGQTPERFVEELIRKHLKPDDLSDFFVVERAHRMPSGRWRPGMQPRPMIAKILNYRDRDAILRQARESAALRYDNATISIFLDFTQMVQKQRRNFQSIKRTLRDKGVKYAMLYPAKLRVEADGKACFFDRPELVADWLELRTGSGTVERSAADETE